MVFREVENQAIVQFYVLLGRRKSGGHLILLKAWAKKKKT